MTDKIISIDDLKVLLARAGLTVAPDHLEEMRDAYQMLQAMRDRVRQARGYDAEPAHIFTPARR